jgi:hypothetical protein
MGEELSPRAGELAVHRRCRLQGIRVGGRTSDPTTAIPRRLPGHIERIGSAYSSLASSAWHWNDERLDLTNSFVDRGRSFGNDRFGQVVLDLEPLLG